MLLLFVLALPGRRARADGCYFPEVAFKKLPAIPRQRALLSFRNGTERLVIESTLDAEGQSFGWVIPLPARPTKFEKASPGLLKTLSLVIRPRITHDLGKALDLWYVVAALVGIWAVVVSILRSRSRLFAAVLLVVLLPAGLLLAPLGKRGKDATGREAGHVEGIEVEETVTIGSYELSVLKADTAAALDEWLGVNGFARLPAAGIGIVSDYVKEGWRFVAAKLRREGKGLSVPHPLAMSFPVEKPVYPMRLTSLAGSSLYLELFVVADKRAHSGSLGTEFCDTYRHKERMTRYGDKAMALVGESFEQNIGHPAAPDEMWDGCVLTKLAGELAPSDMAEDIALSLRSARPYWRHLYSRKGARDTSLRFALLLWCLAVPAAILVAYPQLVAGRPRGFGLAAAVTPGAALSAALWGIVYLALPKTEVETMSGRLYYGHSAYRLEERAAEIAEEHFCFPGRTLAEVTAAYDEYFRYSLERNAFTGERIRREDSSGNYTILEDERGIVFRTYRKNGFPIDMIVSVDGIIRRYAALLKGERPPYRELERLGLTRDPRIVEPILDCMSYWLDKRHHINTTPLTKLTGVMFQRDRYEKWPRWWERNKDKPRVEWLRASGAVFELARLGDQSAVPILLEGLKSGYRRLRESAVGLALMGRDEGFRYLDVKLHEKRSGVLSGPYHVALVEAMRRHPEKGAPIILRHVKRLRSGSEVRRYAPWRIRQVVDLLGPAIKVPPPLDVSDEAKLDEFIAAADRWCASRGIAPSSPSRP